jgi:glutamate-1-semialdehyde aminotransferase
MPWAIRSLDFIDADALNTAFNQHTREIAGVIIEPVQVRNGLVADDEYLESWRASYATATVRS